MMGSGHRRAVEAAESCCVEGAGPLRLGVLVDHPIQYFSPLHRALAARAEIDLTVLYCNRVGVAAARDPLFDQVVQWDIPLLDGYRSVFLSEKARQGQFEPQVLWQLLRGRFHVLLAHGYASVTNAAAIWMAKQLGGRVLLRGDTRFDRRHANAPYWRAWLKKRLFRQIDGFLAVGSLNREYYLGLGADPDKVLFAPFSVDNGFFALDEDQAGRCRDRVRGELGLGDGRPLAIFVGKLTPQKRPLDLLEAWKLARRAGSRLELAVVGSGVLESQLRARIDGDSLAGVHLLGFRNQSELPALLAAADLFVLPSECESWGLAVNEAMAAGLPVVVTDEVGAAEDLVRGRGTGIVYPCGDIEALSRAFCDLSASSALRQSMRIRARSLIREWDIDSTAAAISAAALAVAGFPGPPPWRLVDRPAGAAASQ